MPVAPATSKRLMTSNSVSAKQESHVQEPGPSTSNNDTAPPPTPQVHVNGKPAISSSTPRRPRSSASNHAPEADGSGWGANFWVTLVDPQTGVSFYACPATGEVSWDPPIGNFLLPPSPEGEWWEMTDESTGLAYYYQTKTGETVWERPQAFVIPLGVLQNTALARRLSLTNRNSLILPQTSSSASDSSPSKPVYRRSRSYVDDASSNLQPRGSAHVRQRTQSASRATKGHSPNASPSSSKSPRHALRRSISGERYSSYHNGPAFPNISPLAYERGHPLAPIPGSPYNTDASPPPSPSRKSMSRTSTSSWHNTKDKEKNKERDPDKPRAKDVLSVSVPRTLEKDSPTRQFYAHTPASNKDDQTSRPQSSKSSKSAKSASFLPFHAPQPQSLNAALEKLALHSAPTSPIKKNGNVLTVGTDGRTSRHSTSLGRASGREAMRPRLSMDPFRIAPKGKGVASPVSPNSASFTGSSPKSASPLAVSPTSSIFNGKLKTPVSSSASLPPLSPLAATKESASTSPNGNNRQWMQSMIGKEISEPVFDLEATQNMSPVKMRNAGRPILVEQPAKDKENMSPWDNELGTYAHRKKASLNTGTYPILPEDLASDIQQFSETQFAQQYFSTHRTGFIFRRKVPVEQLMTWQKSPLSAPLLQLNKLLHKEAIKTFKSIQRIIGDRDRDRPTHNGSTPSLVLVNALLEEERCLLGEGIHHGELRDEIYCQVMKQLNGNPNPESVFKGWQLMCVLLVTFPPSKNFEATLRNFLHRATYQPEGRIDVMAKYCLRRLVYISRKGPRGKPPTLAEIEATSDAAFHPSIFGESLDAIFRLQERNYPQQQVPVVLPFLADGILALSGMKSEGIFRVPGDSDAVSELKLRIDKGYYTLDSFDDPHVLASLIKLWLRELADPLIPDEMYNDCITDSQDPEACVMIVHRLPTINRRVVLFVVSFLQLFLDEKVQSATKMTAPNLALVMAPNLLRCSSESMTVVFTNAQYEQTFVHNLLLHLKCDEVDLDYIPAHGHGAIPAPSPPLPLPKTRTSKTRCRLTAEP